MIARCSSISVVTQPLFLASAGPDTSKGVLISIGAVAILAVVTFSLSGKPPVPKQASDIVSKVKDLNEF